MRRAGWILATLSVMHIATAQASCPTGAMTAAAAREDLELAIATVETAMPDLFWRQTETAWSRRKAEARALAVTAVSEEEFYRALRPLMAGIGEGHLSVQRSDGMTCRYRESARLLPLDLLWRNDGVFVEAGYGDAAGIAPGSEVISINGADRAAMLDEMMRFSAHDGAIETGTMRDRHGPGYAIVRWQAHGSEAAFEVVLKTTDGKTTTHILTPVPVSARPGPPEDTSPLATLSWVDGETAYLYVPTFSNRRYRAANANYRATIQAIFDEIDEKGAASLILDLRDNGGGSEPNESILFSYLVAEPIRKYASVRSRPNALSVTSLSGVTYTHDIYDAEELPTVRPGPDGDLYRMNAPPEGLMTRWERAHPVFRGRLVVLAGGYTFSGGAELTSMLHATRRGLFVGEEVGGTYGGNTSGYKWELELPHSAIELGVPLLAFRFVWDEPQPNRGAMPHCHVQPRIGERRVTNDPAFDVAVAVLQKEWTTPVQAACPGSAATSPATP